MNKKIRVQDLLDLCKNKRKIYCYGSGHCGIVTYCFLKINGIHVDSFIVTNEDNKPLFNVIPWRNIGMEDLKGALIILSLAEKLHDQIRTLIRDKCDEAEIFPITLDFFENLPQKAHDMALVERLCRKPSDKCDKSKYKQMAKELFEQYENIKFCYINTDKIGNLALNRIYYCSIKRPPKELWLFYPGPSGRIVNDFLDKKIKENDTEGITVVNEDNIGFWQYIMNNYRERISVNGLWPIPGYYDKINRQISSIDKTENVNFMRLKPEECVIGETFLQKFHINDFVAIFARDSNYTKKVLNFVAKEDSVVDEYRDVPISSFNLTAKYLKKMNISSVRMGSMPNNDAEAPIFDYGRKYHDDFLDVFLCSRCRYFVGTPSGVQHIADLFGKLMVMVNVPVLSTQGNFAFVGGRENLMILQKYWDSKNQKFLTIREMLNHEFYGQSDYAPNGPRKALWLYYEMGIEPIKNTPEEILAVVKEMEERLRGEELYDAIDIRLQAEYDAILKEFEDESRCFFNYRMGREFLRQNQWLLD